MGATKREGGGTGEVSPLLKGDQTFLTKFLPCLERGAQKVPDLRFTHFVDHLLIIKVTQHAAQWLYGSSFFKLN